MSVIYKTSIIDIGKNATDFIKYNMFITFKDNAPEELRNLCYIHSENDLIEDIRVGDTLYIGEASYKVTAVGNQVNNNLKELGHITFKFSGETTSETPGTLFLEQKEIIQPEKGTILKIIRD